MTAVLSPQFDDSFMHASVREVFISGAERDVIEELEKREKPLLGDLGASCNTNLFFGFFFNGTRNNYVKADPSKTHSNVARLYDCFPGQSVPGVLPSTTDWTYKSQIYTNFFRVYIPGVASPFKDVKDSGTGFWDETLGAGAGRKANERILWALLQAINNVHRYFFSRPLLSPSEETALATRLDLSKDARHAMTGVRPSDDQSNPVDIPRIEFEKLLRRLHANVSQQWKKNSAPPAKIDPGIVGTIYISTFGFSHGATQARGFANWLDSICRLDAMIRGEAPRTIKDFNDSSPSVPSSRAPITDIMREQAVLQMAWLRTAQWGPAPLDQMENFSRASSFDKNDLESSNKEFNNELKELEKWLAARGNRRPVNKPWVQEISRARMGRTGHGAAGADPT